MQCVEDLVAANGVHVAIKSAVRLKPVLCKRETLPFGERLHDFCPDSCMEDVKGDGTLHAV